MTWKWYATLPHPKMYPHTKFGIPTSKNMGDMDRTRKRDGHTDGRMDGRTVQLLYASQSSFGGIKTCFHSHFYANFHVSVTLVFLIRFSWNFLQNVELSNWERYTPLLGSFFSSLKREGAVIWPQSGVGNPWMWHWYIVLWYNDISCTPDWGFCVRENSISIPHTNL